MTTMRHKKRAPYSAHVRKPIALDESARANWVAKQGCVTTCGEFFDDGTIIELVAGTSSRPNLLLFSGSKKAVSDTRVQYKGYVYEAPSFDPTLLRATCFPETFSDYGTARELVIKIADHFMKRLNFADRESKLLAAFPFTTWLSDRLLLAPSLLICGPPQAIHVLRLLRCFCRRPLMLADLSPAGLRNMPADLHSTSTNCWKPPRNRACSAAFNVGKKPSRPSVVPAPGAPGLGPGSTA